MLIDGLTQRFSTLSDEISDLEIIEKDTVEIRTKLSQLQKLKIFIDAIEQRGKNECKDFKTDTYSVASDKENDRLKELLRKFTKLYLEQNKESDLILNIESIHTRFGKDKTNYLSIQPETEIIFDCSAYFATFQITSEFDPDRDQAVETRGRSKKEILDDIISARRNGKRVWVLTSMFNDENSDRIELISLFKNTNAELIIDEVDYAAWSKIEIIKKVVENVIN